MFKASVSYVVRPPQTNKENLTSEGSISNAQRKYVQTPWLLDFLAIGQTVYCFITLSRSSH